LTLSANVFHEKDATLIAEKVCVLKPLVGGWWEEKVDLTPCNGATPSESRIREIRTYGSMRGRRSKEGRGGKGGGAGGLEVCSIKR